MQVPESWFVKQGTHWVPETLVTVTDVLMLPFFGSGRKSIVELISITGEIYSGRMTMAMYEIAARNNDLLMCVGRQICGMRAKDVDSYNAPYRSTTVGLEQSK